MCIVTLHNVHKDYIDEIMEICDRLEINNCLYDNTIDLYDVDIRIHGADVYICIGNVHIMNINTELVKEIVVQ